MQLDATLIVNPHCLSLLCLVDSGADENFLDLNLVTQAGIRVEQLLYLLDANDLKGDLLACVIHHTVPLYIPFSGNHCGTTQFHVIPSFHAPIVLGHWSR